MVKLTLTLPISNIQRRNRQPGKGRKRVEGLLKNPTNSDEDITEIYICERHESIIEQLNDLYDEGFAGEACDLCGKSVQTNNRTLVYLDGELDPWRVICAADTREVIAKILA